MWPEACDNLTCVCQGAKVRSSLIFRMMQPAQMTRVICQLWGVCCMRNNSGVHAAVWKGVRCSSQEKQDKSSSRAQVLHLIFQLRKNWKKYTKIWSGYLFFSYFSKFYNIVILRFVSSPLSEVLCAPFRLLSSRGRMLLIRTLYTLI